MIISYAMFLSYKVKIKVHGKEKLHAVRFVFIYFPCFQSFHGFLPSRKPLLFHQSQSVGFHAVLSFFCIAPNI